MSMRIKEIMLPTKDILDWKTFHLVCGKTFGFFEGYGDNMNAWIDCMSSLDCPDEPMTSLSIATDEILVINMPDFEAFSHRCPEPSKALLECSALVNQRRVEAYGNLMIALAPS